MVDAKNIVKFPDPGIIEAEAAEWLVRLDRGSLSGEETAKYREWLAQSSAHRDAMQRLSAVWNDLEAIKDYAVSLPKPEATGATVKRRGIRGMFAIAAAAVLVIAVGGISYWHRSEAVPAAVIYETAVGGQRTVTLADGSTILLNTDSRVDVVYSRKMRRVQLMRGEAYFEVVHDETRPFTVASGAQQVRDLGTAFAVRQMGKSLEVTVTKGTVELAVSPAADETQRVAVLNAGQIAAFDHKLVYARRLSSAEINRQLSWRDGVLVYAGEPLVSVAADISRYTDLKIELSDPKLAAMPVGGYFEIGKLRAVFDALESNFGIRAEWIDDTHVRLYTSRLQSPRRAH